MYATTDRHHKMSLCVLVVFVANLINQLECRKIGGLTVVEPVAGGYPNSKSNQNLRTTDATVADATQANQQTTANNEQSFRALEQKLAGLSPEARQATVNSLNRYFLAYNLLKTRPLKRNGLIAAASLHPSFSSPSHSRPFSLWNSPESSPENSFLRSTPTKRKFDFPRLAFTPELMAKKTMNRQENKVNQQSSTNLTAFLNVVRDWKKEQPTCSQLKQFWETAISRLTDHFLNENNDLYMQPHLNQMDNPIYLALLINLLRNDQNDPLKVFSLKEQPAPGASQLKESPNNILSHNSKNNKHSRPNDELLNKAIAEQSKPLPMDYLMKMLNVNKAPSEPYYFKNFKMLDKESAKKFIPNPMDRQDHSLEIIEDGPTFIYNVDSDSNPSQFSAAQFWGDAQLSKPVNKPEAHY